MHSHHGGHDHGGHGHLHEGMATGILSAALAATLCLVVAEFAGGYISHSMALTSDAVHNLSDAPTIMISWLAARWAQRPADAKRTFGYQRAGILAAFTNSILLLLVAAGLLWAAVERLEDPVPVNDSWMIGLSILALLINGGITLALVRGHRDLNLRALLIHNAGDALSNVAILAGAVLIHFTHLFWLDSVLAAAIGVFVLWSSLGILRESAHVLLEGLPREMKLSDVAHAILDNPGVQEVHDIHIWTLGSDHHALSCHVRIPDMHMEESEQLMALIRKCLHEKFGIDHMTIQYERAGLPSQGYYMPEPYRGEKS